MKSWYDKEDDILNIRLKDGKYWKSVELPNGVVFDIDENGTILSVEILKASKVFSGDVKRVIEAVKQAS